MNLPIVDTKAIAREQNALKRKYEKVLEQVNELPMSQDTRFDIQNLFLRAYQEETRDIVNMAMNGRIEDIEPEPFPDPEPSVPVSSINLGGLDL